MSIDLWAAVSASMPKALAKSKHGRKTGTVDHGQSDPVSVTHQPAREVSLEPSPDTPTSWAHHKSHKHDASSKAEKRRDKVLTKLCDKACANRASMGPPAPTVVGSLVPAGVPRPVTPDQLLLQDYPVAISTDDLWGSASPSQAASSDPPVSQGPSVPPSAALPPVAVPCQLLPDQLQHIIEAAVQKSLLDSVRPAAMGLYDPHLLFLQSREFWRVPRWPELPTPLHVLICANRLPRRTLILVIPVCRMMRTYLWINRPSLDFFHNRCLSR